MIFVITGMTATGKDTVVNMLTDMRSSNGKPYLERIRNVTTRPMRPTENGTEYIFTDDAGYDDMVKNNQITCLRQFVTVQGNWRYGLSLRNLNGDVVDANDGSKTYICILDPKGAKELKKKYGDAVSIMYFFADLELRRERYLSRTNRTEEDFAEWTRREESDFEDFVMSGFATNDAEWAIKVTKNDSVENIANGVLNIILTEEWKRAEEYSQED